MKTFCLVAGFLKIFIIMSLSMATEKFMLLWPIKHIQMRKVEDESVIKNLTGGVILYSGFIATRIPNPAAKHHIVHVYVKIPIMKIRQNEIEKEKNNIRRPDAFD